MTDVDWNMSLAYRMVRERYNALTQRQRILQGEQQLLTENLGKLKARISDLADAIAVVEKHGGDAGSLRAQIGEAHADRRNIEPRHVYLEDVTSLIAANLRLINQAHDALHWLNFENRSLADFDAQTEVPKA